MRRQGILLIAVLCVMGSVKASGAAAEMKIGVVDLQKAMELSEEGQKAKALFQKKVEQESWSSRRFPKKGSGER